MMYGMKRTTVYLPEELKARLEAEAKRRGVTEAEVIRVAVDKELHRRLPRGGFLRGGPDDIAASDLRRDNRDVWLEGFGEH